MNTIEQKIKVISNWLADENWEVQAHDTMRFSASKTLNGIKYSFYYRIDDGKLKVRASNIRSTIDEFYWVLGTTRINISMSKTEDQIFKDLKKRFVSNFQQDVDKLITETIVPHYEYLKNKFNTMKQALDVLNIKDDLKKDRVKGYLSDNETYIELAHYSTGFKITIDSISIEQLTLINKILTKGK